MILDVRAGEGALAIFGSLVDLFVARFQHVRSTLGVDQHKDVKHLMPPSSDPLSAGCLHVPSDHFNSVAGLRVAPESFSAADIAASVAYSKQKNVHPGNDRNSSKN